IEAAGTLPLETTAAEGVLHVSAQVDLPGIARLAPAANLDVQGKATVSGEIRGTLQHLNPTLSVTVDCPRIASRDFSPAITNASLKGYVRDGAIEVEAASAAWGKASITAAGIVPLALLAADLPAQLTQRSGPAHFTADLKDLDLATLHGAPQGLTGSVSAHL